MTGRCAVEELAKVARRERVGRVLSYITKAALIYDVKNRTFWERLEMVIGKHDPVVDGVLPHWSRFVSQTGVTRNGGGDIQWLHCQ